MLKRALLCTAAFVFAASAGFSAPKAASTAKSWPGYVTDSKCATNAKARTDAACVKKCIDGGDKYVLYDTVNKKVYQLDPQSAVADHATHHVRIYGTLDGDTITVTSVKMIGAKAKAAPAAGY
ncbi:MAG TPA: hypothetical protein VJN90_06035 [Candidatus Acidoferrales bacterium]|nr:hypothetical protein [Candidatus Acidoferrales bacterium]